MRAIRHLPGARQDFDESLDWYSERRRSAAEGFVEAVDAALQRIAESPSTFPLLDKIHRSCPVSRYPFRVVFRVVSDEIIVVAIAHAKRRGGYWKARS